jgi:hypothetical protein
VYDHELAHIWPPEAALRQKQIELIEKFAAQNGLAVIIRDTGLNASFRKKPGARKQENLDARNGDSSTRQLEPANEAQAAVGQLQNQKLIGTAQEIGDPAGKRLPKLPTFAAT